MLDWTSADVLDQLIIKLSTIVAPEGIVIIDGINLITTMLEDNNVTRNGIVSFVNRLYDLNWWDTQNYFCSEKCIEKKNFWLNN